ncbi:MAG: permease-like cell division protein FtsX, partial [Negativicutes bacterium]|nr:permease-like cell division protein FtsX [Negativicutes bacterium]
MKINTWEHFIVDAFSSLRHNRLMTVAAITTVALSLLILGTFITVLLNLNFIADTLESQVQISVYLKDELTPLQQREVGTRITRINGVRQVMFVDKEQALKQFRERLGDQQGILDALDGVNPLPNYFEVKVDNPDQVLPTVEIIRVIAGVEKVRYGQEAIENLFKITHIIRVAGLILIVLLAAAALFIIANTIRITVFARRQEIRIMKYVGATDWFIRWPFIIEGLILGFAGALVAAAVLFYSYG